MFLQVLEFLGVATIIVIWFLFILVVVASFVKVMNREFNKEKKNETNSPNDKSRN